MANQQNQRPRFFEGQYLGADDLTTAIEYYRIQAARHALGANTWGIAAGLLLEEVEKADGGYDVLVTPGYAWDGFGRPIVVLAPQILPTDKFIKLSKTYPSRPEGLLVDVWLSYDETQLLDVPPGFEVCDATNPLTRVAETFRIDIGPQERHSQITVAGYDINDKRAHAVLFPDESIPRLLNL